MTKTRPPTSMIAPFGLRMQPELREKLEAAAEAAGRSLNAEIVARLQASLAAGTGQPLTYDMISLLRDQEARIIKQVEVLLEERAHYDAAGKK